MRKSGKSVVVLAMLLCGVTGSLARQPIAAKAVSLQSTTDYPVIARVVGRNYTMVVTSKPTGPVFIVTGKDGQKLTNHTALAAIKQNNPCLLNKAAPTLPMGSIDASIDTDAFIGD